MQTSCIAIVDGRSCLIWLSVSIGDQLNRSYYHPPPSHPSLSSSSHYLKRWMQSLTHNCCALRILSLVEWWAYQKVSYLTPPLGSVHDVVSAGDTASLPKKQLQKVEDWLEWEETKLRPSLASNHSNVHEAVLGQLEVGLSGSGSFLGQELTVADIAIFCSLRAKLSSLQVFLIVKFGT